MFFDRTGSEFARTVYTVDCLIKQTVSVSSSMKVCVSGFLAPNLHILLQVGLQPHLLPQFSLFPD